VSVLIKSGEAANGASIARFGAAVGVQPSGVLQPAARENPLVAENVKLLALVEKYEAEIAAHTDLLKKAFAEGEQAGRLAMESEFEDDRTASLALLAQGINAAQNDLSVMLENAENISVLVAQAVLEKLFGEPNNYREYVIDLIRHQFRRVDQNSIIAIEVARSDFPDTNEVADLARSLVVPEQQIRVSDQLNAGDCIMRMQIGTLDVGLNQQWGSIQALLGELADADDTTGL
jgi:flagellar biosynthesis/type III secretory pathway protein FliH